MTLVEKFNNNLDEFLGDLISSIVSKDMVEIRFEFEDNEQWSVATSFGEEDDSETSLRLHSGSRYFVYLGYYDEKDEFFEVVKQLTPEQAATIPAALSKVMAKVLDDEQGMRVPGSLLIK